MGDATAPYAEIRRTGRWTYYVTVKHGILSYGYGWIVLGRRRAERKGARELARYQAAEQRRQQPVAIIRPTDLDGPR